MSADEELIAAIEARRNDTAFMERLEESIKRNKPILDRLADNKPGKMTYAATNRCPCGAGLAYDDTCVMEPFKYPSYWDCSAILLGEAIPSGEPRSVQHTDKVPFSFYEIKSEGQPSANGATTRPS